MQVIPLQATPSQVVQVALNQQNCQVNVYQKWTGLFLDLYLSDQLVLAGVLGRNQKLMVMDAYLGFVGDLLWLDNHGASDPDYTGLAERFSLIYLLPSDIPANSLYV